MKILGKIENRTENWKTARLFAPYYGSCALPLAQRLAKPFGETAEVAHLELFWNGMRDFIAGQNEDSDKLKDEVTRIYNLRFPKLQEDICNFGKFKGLHAESYSADNKEGLYNNLIHTEIDIVIETEKFLFIGEAKGETNLHSSGSHVLVHQLVRQYVMAIVLNELCRSYKSIVPFVVGVNRKQRQVEFMIKRGWLREENVLGWENIENPMKLHLMYSDL